jgi:hypothetical protein
MAKKKQKEEVVETQPQNLEPNGELKLAPMEAYENCEWCFQFDDDEPQIFAWTDEEQPKDEEPKVIFTISNTKNSYINFTDKVTGRVFRIFSRELSDDGKQMRNTQKLAFEQFKSQNNESQNKETQA